MLALAGRLLVLVGLVTLCVLEADGSAGAKVLPVDNMGIATVRPQVGQPVDVVVRFAPGFALGDQYAWASHEVAVFPSSRTDAGGWPLDRTDFGIPVQLHQVSGGVYRGAFTVGAPGEYRVISWSAFYAHEDRTSGVAVTRPYPRPLSLRIVSAAASPTRSSGISMLAIGATVVSVAVIVSVVSTWYGRRRRSRRRVEEPAMRPAEDRVLVSHGPHRP